jgi:hypothetical protein
VRRVFVPYLVVGSACVLMTVGFQNFENVKFVDTEVAVRAAPPAIFKRIFATAKTFHADEAAITIADAACMRDELKPRDILIAKAMIVEGATRRACATPNCANGSSENIDWVLQPRTTYQRLDGTVLGTANDAGLITLPSNASIGTHNLYYWTGLQDDWTSGANCSSWKSVDPRMFGQSGAALAVDTAMIFQIQQYCDVAQSLVCVEQ